MTTTVLTFQLGRKLKNRVRDAVTAHPAWETWRTANGVKDASAMGRDLLCLACHDMALSVPEIATAHGLRLPKLLTAAEAAATTDDDTNTPEDDTDMNTAAATAATAATASYEGRAPMDVVADMLAPIDGLVGSKVMDMLTASVAPLAMAAVAGPRIVTKTVTVKVGDGADAASSTRHVSITRTTNARTLFGLTNSDASHWADLLNATTNVYDGTDAEGVPSIDPHHVWDAEALAYLTLAAQEADAETPLRTMTRVLMYGPAGTGKTTTAAQFAAHTGRPFYRVAFDRTTEAAELVGQRMPAKGGGTVFHEGALVSAMQVPGAVILLDEPSFLRPGVAAVLQTILDTGVVFLKEDGNRRVAMAPGVIVAAADNTNLTGDNTGRYADTMAQNVALLDRFGLLVAMDYLPESAEAKVLVARTGVDVEAAKAMVAFATTTRKGAAGGLLTTGCSLRRLMAWAVSSKAGVPSKHAFKAAVMNSAASEDRETLRGLETNTVDHARLDHLVRGVPMPAAPGRTTVAPGTGETTTAKGAQAAAVFGAAPLA